MRSRFARLLAPLLMVSLAQGQRSDVAGLVSLITRASSWTQVAAIRVDARMFHPQGMVKIGDDFFVSSVEVSVAPQRMARPDAGGFDRTPGSGVGHLFRIGPEGRVLADLVLGEGALYHPGGMDFDGRQLWIPVAEYRPDSRSIVYRVDPVGMRATAVLRVADHIGAVAIDRDGRVLYGWRWGSRRLYGWRLGPDGRPVDPGANLAGLRRDNPSHYVDYQDCQYAGRLRLVCTGIAELGGGTGSPAVTLGGLELVSLTDARPLHQVPVTRRSPAGHVLTRNPSWFEATPSGLRGYFMPDDEQSTIFVYDIGS